MKQNAFSFPFLHGQVASSLLTLTYVIRISWGFTTWVESCGLWKKRNKYVSHVHIYCLVREEPLPV